MNYLSKCDPINGCGKSYPADLNNCPHCGADHAFSSPAPVDPKWWTYDIETYPNIFTCCLIHVATGMELVYEISDRKNQQEEFIQTLFNLGQSKAWGVGFNNQSFDYPVIHWVAQNPGCSVQEIYDKAQQTITASNGNRWSVMVWDNEQIFPQLDLLLLNHYDNKARMTSLKALEIAMQSHIVKDLPYPVGMVLNDEQKDNLITYNRHDTRETTKKMMRCLGAIEFREELTKLHGRNFMNHNDTKIGKDYFVMELEKNGVQCFIKEPGQRRQPRQTPRESIAFKDVIFPWIRFDRPEFNTILERFRTKTIYKKQLDELADADEAKAKLVTKGVFKDLQCTIDGYTFVFGVGGIHGSIESTVVETSDTHQIVDVDVSSMYPSIAIVNRIYPEHLGEKFCDINKYFFDERLRVGKKTTAGAVYKLAMNGVYGDSNNAYGPFYDPKYTMTVTVNGQLMLAMLCEWLLRVSGLSIIQSNTDGVTMLCPHGKLDEMRQICKQWESLTKLELEEVLYKKMAIRDVNNYIAVPYKGDVKRKGAYEYEYDYHQDPSAMIAPMAAEAALVDGRSVREFITGHRNPFDFMLRAKVNRSDTLLMRWPEFAAEQELQKTTRYFMSRNGGLLVKKMKPKGQPGTYKRKNKLTDDFYFSILREIQAKGGERMDAAGTPYDERIHTSKGSMWQEWTESSLCAGYRVTECADASDFDWTALNYEWYIQEAEKLVLPLLN